jgi:hypothetical protein
VTWHEHLEDRGKGQAPPLDNTLRILNDLARGQDVMMQAIAQMATNTQEIQSNMGNIGASGASGGVVPVGTQQGPTTVSHLLALTLHQRAKFLDHFSLTSREDNRQGTRDRDNQQRISQSTGESIWL